MRILDVLRRFGLSNEPHAGAPGMLPFVSRSASDHVSFSEEERRQFFEKYPPTQTVSLSNGARTTLPMRIRDMEVLQVIGTVKPDVMNEFLRPRGVELIAIPLLGGLAAISAVNYRDTSIGAYQELVIGALVKGLEDPQKTGFHMIQLYVTTEISRLLGREVWGFPKDIGVIRMDPHTDHSQNFTATLPDGRLLASGTWRKRLPMPAGAIEKPFHTDRMWVEADARRRGIRVGLAHPRSIVYDPDTDWGRLLQQARFRARMWQSIPATMAVLLPPKRIVGLN